MKLSTGIIFCFLILGISSQRWGTFLKEAGQRAKDVWRAYSDVREEEANLKDSDKGPGSTWAAKVTSDARGNTQIVTDLSKNGDSGYGWEDSRADQFANEWDRSGEDPNHCRPAGQPLASTKLY
uniref:Serum amyloid A protein n=1 Tax=Bos indicus x Bos taurus TaxID=30522 RepID=A0A4W2DWA3_BOBOX